MVTRPDGEDTTTADDREPPTSSIHEPLTGRHRRFSGETTHPRKIALFGHFGASNFGNESTLAAVLYHLRRLQPDAELTCICSDPEATSRTYDIDAVPLVQTFFRSWAPKRRLTRRVRKSCRIFLALVCEPYSWMANFRRLRNTDLFIVPGTGLLTDAYGLYGWGPYGVFKWCLIARACRCKVLFLNVGAGPLYGALGRWFVKSALSLAEVRSYRDATTKQYLENIGVRTDNDAVYPDLAFGLPESLIPSPESSTRRRPVVGLGVMEYAGRYSVPRPQDGVYVSYLESLVMSVEWWLAHGYDIRLLIGDGRADLDTKDELLDLLRQRLSADAVARHVLDELPSSVRDLLSQIATTHIVVGTRFHNVLFALLCSKPVIAISHHQKCQSLMEAAGLAHLSIDINTLNPDDLIRRFQSVEQTADNVRARIETRRQAFHQVICEEVEHLFSNE